jgi:hypothetical protein
MTFRLGYRTAPIYCARMYLMIDRHSEACVTSVRIFAAFHRASGPPKDASVQSLQISKRSID